MAHAVTLNASILVQDMAVTPPATVASDSKTDQLTEEDEMLEMSITVEAGASDQTVDLSTPGLTARSLYITTDEPITMKQGASSFAQPIRSIFVGTYDITDAPASLKFSNAGDDDAQVKIILGSKNT